MCSLVLAQAPKPAADDSPRFEIRRFVFDGATLIPQERLAEITQPFTGPGRQFADVQRALEAVERAYAQAGWSAVQVVLPEQELERGEVRLQIVEARIGRVLVEGNKFFDEANVRGSVPALAPGKAPNINEIARNLRIANENPSKQETALLRSGQEEGTVDAVVRVVDEKPSKGSITVDNTGNATTGKLRVGFGYLNANAFGGDEVLSLQYVTSPYSNNINTSGERTNLSLEPNGRVMVLGAGLKIPFYSLGDTLDIVFGNSNVNSGNVGNLFSITGAGTVLSGRYTHNLDKVGDYEHRIAISQDWRTYDNKGVRPVGGTTQLAADVTVHPIAFTYLGFYRRQNSETSFSAGYTRNLPGGNDGDRQTFCQTFPVARNNGIGDCARADYEILKWSFNHNYAFNNDWQARAALNGQYTRDMLVPGEQFGIGGADSVRGFLEREIANDFGYRGSMEVYTPDFGKSFDTEGVRARVLGFIDWGKVMRNHPGPAEQRSQNIWSHGVGLRFSKGTNVAFRLDWAQVDHQGGTEQANRSRIHASFSYVF